MLPIVKAPTANPLTFPTATQTQFFGGNSAGTALATTPGYTSVDGSFTSPFAPFLLVPGAGRLDLGLPFTVKIGGVLILGAGTYNITPTLTVFAGKNGASPFRADVNGSYFTPTVGTNDIAALSLGAIAAVATTVASGISFNMVLQMTGDSNSGLVGGFRDYVITTTGTSAVSGLTYTAITNTTGTVLTNNAANTGPLTGLVWGPAAFGKSVWLTKGSESTAQTLSTTADHAPASTDPVFQIAVGIQWTVTSGTPVGSSVLSMLGLYA